MSRDPDHETFIFRRSGRLAARNILHLQAQLMALEFEINQLDERAGQSTDFEEKQAPRRWETLVKHAKDDHRPEEIRMEKLDQLHGLLRDYCTVLRSTNRCRR